MQELQGAVAMVDGWDEWEPPSFLISLMGPPSPERVSLLLKLESALDKADLLVAFLFSEAHVVSVRAQDPSIMQSVPWVLFAAGDYYFI